MVWTQCFGLKYFTLVTLLLKVPQVWTCKPSESCEDVIYLERPHDLCVLSFTSQTIASETVVSPTIKPDCEYSDSDFSLQSPPSHSLQLSLLWGFRVLLLSVQVFSILYYIILQCLGHDRKTRRFCSNSHQFSSSLGRVVQMLSVWVLQVAVERLWHHSCCSGFSPWPLSTPTQLTNKLDSVSHAAPCRIGQNSNAPLVTQQVNIFAMKIGRNKQATDTTSHL